MDLTQAIELYGQLGAAGVICCLFVFMIMNLIKRANRRFRINQTRYIKNANRNQFMLQYINKVD